MYAALRNHNSIDTGNSTFGTTAVAENMALSLTTDRAQQIDPPSKLTRDLSRIDPVPRAGREILAVSEQRLSSGAIILWLADLPR